MQLVTRACAFETENETHTQHTPSSGEKTKDTETDDETINSHLDRSNRRLQRTAPRSTKPQAARRFVYLDLDRLLMPLAFGIAESRLTLRRARSAHVYDFAIAF